VRTRERGPPSASAEIFMKYFQKYKYIAGEAMKHRDFDQRSVLRYKLTTSNLIYITCCPTFSTELFEAKILIDKSNKRFIKQNLRHKHRNEYFILFVISVQKTM
jgi:hypothetical protein